MRKRSNPSKNYGFVKVGSDANIDANALQKQEENKIKAADISRKHMKNALF